MTRVYTVVWALLLLTSIYWQWQAAQRVVRRQAAGKEAIAASVREECTTLGISLDSLGNVSARDSAALVERSVAAVAETSVTVSWEDTFVARTVFPLVVQNARTVRDWDESTRAMVRHSWVDWGVTRLWLVLVAPAVMLVAIRWAIQGFVRERAPKP